MNINEFWKIELTSGEIKVVRSFRNYNDLTKRLFFEFGSDLKSIKNANYDDVNWYRQDNVIKEI